MHLLRNLLLGLFILVVIVLVGLALVVRQWTRGPLPQHDGELTIAGLNDTVEIYRDAWGVPHIYASNVYDLVFAQGYTHAQDRWWQMEFSRHIGSGRIQELTGASDSVMQTDIALRRMGWHRVAEYEVENTYSQEALDILQAFADGVNAYITSRPASELAIEYNLLGVTGVSIEIEPWTPADSVVWAKAMAWNLAEDGAELNQSELLEIIGEDMLADYLPPYPYDSKPTMILATDLPIDGSSATASLTNNSQGLIGIQADESLAVLDDFLLRGIGIGSNNWVVSGELTETGLPMMANDMHLGMQMPSIWYEIGLHCSPVTEECPLNVRGFQFSPAPLITAGHNDSISWAFTDHTDDVVDYYLIKVNPDNELQYEWNGEWRDMIVHEEMIAFGDSDETITVQIRETHLGPIVNDHQMDDDGNLLGFNNDDPRAMHWTALQPGTLLQAVMHLNTASNWDEFRTALQDWDVPSQNVVYADIEGNIGMQNPGRIPIRANGHTGGLPMPGWTDEFEWLGFIPYDNLPRVYNPERGYIATANHANVPPEYFDQLRDQLSDEFGDDANYEYTQFWAYGYRAERIVELLETFTPHNNDTFNTILGDNKLISAEELIPYFADLEFDDSDITAARDWLLEWDYQMHMDSPYAALYANVWVSLLDHLFNDQLGEDNEAGGGSNNMWATYLLMDDPENIWWDDVDTDTTETRDDILTRAFEEGLANTIELLGDDRSEWQWGTLHTTTFVSQPLGLSGISLIEDMVNHGPVPTSGSTATINTASWSARSGNFEVGSSVSERVIYHIGDWDASLSIHPTGQSGHPFSQHYSDMIDPWRFVQFKPMLWSPEQVEEAAVNVLILQPE